ncbi:tetratricopeptide repeat protein, partial [Beggiatoa alba]|nr:tetratricopeptide repeat protein [Beggiatoa alba]
LVPSSLSLASVDSLTERPIIVKDLHYGAVLFDFYQQNYFSAAVNLLVAQQQNRLQHHQADGQLLLGGLYLSYGLHTEAEEIFQILLDAGTAPEVRDRAWFYLGKIRYQKQLFVEASAALGHVGDALSESLLEEFHTLKANLLMAQKKYPEAMTALQGLVESSRNEGQQQANYARFNLGVALIRAGHEQQGTDLLRRVAILESNASDQKALRDKANLVLGFSVLKAAPIFAKGFFRRVRLHGPYSNKALLGLGWAEVELQRYEQALIPWAELSTRDKTDLAVFEALLASGNVLERLRAYPQALQSYKNAIIIFEQELAALNNSVEAVKAGRLWTDLLSQVSGNEMGWLWEAELLPNTPEAGYLPRVMAGHEFHEAIKNLRDLNFLDGKLSRWQQEIPAFDAMLILRRDTYESQLDKLTPEQTLDQVLDVRTSRDGYTDELARIGEAKDAFALVTEKEKKLLERLVTVEQRIWRLSNQQGPHTGRLDRYRDRYRFYTGLLTYDVETNYAIRFRKVQKNLKSLDAELDDTLQKQNSLQRARTSAPVNFDEYARRIDDKRQRVTALRKDVKAAFVEQQRLLQQMVDVEFDTLRASLIDYLDQARFSLARLQDLATTAGESGGELQ